MVDASAVAICHYGGEFVSSTDGSLSYTGGDAHVVEISLDMQFDDLKAELADLFNMDTSNIIIKYFFANNKRTLITVSTDKDLSRMVELNMSTVPIEAFIINNVANRNIVADSGPSSANKRAAARRKRIVSSEKDTELVANEERALCSNLEDPDGVGNLGILSLWDDLITGEGQEFDNAGEFRTLLCKYAISKDMVYKLIKNESTRVTAICIEKDCPWRLYAATSARKQKFVIKKFHDVHTCGGSGKDGQKLSTKHWLTSLMIEKLRSNPLIKPKEIVSEIFEVYGVKLTYFQVWRTREIAQKELNKTLTETYEMLPSFCGKIMESNPGSVAQVSVSEDSRFHRFFVSFHASLQGFVRGCRPLLFLDRIPLKSNYHYKLLAAAAVDGEDDVYPIAFAVVEEESIDSWFWFLVLLKQAVILTPNITFVSKRHKGLEQAVPTVFEDSHHSYCLSHLVEDLNRELMKGPWSQEVKEGMIASFIGAAQACSIEDFNAYIEGIRNVSNDVAEWALASKPQNWANSQFQGLRYEHYTSNIMDTLASWIPVKSETSIVLMVEAIQCKLTEVIFARREASNAWTGVVTPSVEDKLAKEMKKGHKLNVHRSSESLFEVQGSRVYVVDILQQVCTCCRWQISGLPCEHAIAAFHCANKCVYDYCTRYFRTEWYRLTYSGLIQPIPDLRSLELSSGSSSYLPPARRTPARRRRKRINPNKPVTQKRICSRCKQSGHNKATCDTIM